MKKIDIKIGDIFGYLVIVSPLEERSKRGSLQYLCRCKCGKDVIRSAEHLKYNEDRGRISSCGCRFKDKRPRKKPVDIPTDI